MAFRNRPDSLLHPADSVLVQIDHQPYQLANLNSHDPQAVVNNTTALAKLAKSLRCSGHSHQRDRGARWAAVPVENNAG